MHYYSRTYANKYMCVHTCIFIKKNIHATHDSKRRRGLKRNERGKGNE